MTDKFDNQDNQNENHGKKIRFLLWIGVAVPLAFSVLIGIIEINGIKQFASLFSTLFASATYTMSDWLIHTHTVYIF